MGRSYPGRIATMGFVALIALGAALVFAREPFGAVTLAWQAGRPLTGLEASALARCEDPGWTGVSRVLEQDLDVACPELWLAQTAAAHLGASEARWVEERSAEPAASARERFRLGTVLLLAGRPVPTDWPFLVTDPSVGPGTRAEVLAAALAGHLLARSFDPLLEEDLDRARFLEGDLDGRDGVIRTLRRWSTLPERAPAEERARWTSAVLAQVGLPGDRLEQMLERRRRGLSWQRTPPALAPLLANRGGACADRASGPCLALAADLLALDRSASIEGIDGGPGGDEPAFVLPPRGLRAFSEVATRDAGAVASGAEAFEATARWVALAPEGVRERRLLGAIAWPGAAPDPAAARALAGDPLDVLATRGGSPWAVALAALVLGDLAGVPVEVRSAGAGVRVVAGGQEAWVAPCGDLSGMRPGDGPAWPIEAVVAQAAVEAAGAALRGSRPRDAARLAAFAERMDPVGAKGAVAVVAAVHAAATPEEALGRVAASSVTGVPLPPPAGAEAERAARALAWADAAGSWAVPPDPTRCPSVLGP